MPALSVLSEEVLGEHRSERAATDDDHVERSRARVDCRVSALLTLLQRVAGVPAKNVLAEGGGLCGDHGVSSPTVCEWCTGRVVVFGHVAPRPPSSARRVCTVVVVGD